MKTVRFALLLAALSLLVGCAHSPADPIPPEPPAVGSVQQQTAAAFISASEAESTALKHAGISAENALGLSSRLDYDDGVAEYDIDFCHDGIEYDYDIDAESGGVRSIDKDACDHEPHIAVTADDAGRISRDEAVAIALEHAGISRDEAQRLEVELDRERGLEEYEVSFDAGGYEYDYDIDAATGAILRAEKEWDD